VVELSEAISETEIDPENVTFSGASGGDIFTKKKGRAHESGLV